METVDIFKKLNDANFQESLLANPHKALAEAGLELPATTEVKVVRNSKNNINLVIPPTLAAERAMLTDDDLEQMSAGEVIWGLAGITIGVTAAVAGVLAGVTTAIIAVAENA